jgi:hypothetical protein
MCVAGPLTLRPQPTWFVRVDDQEMPSAEKVLFDHLVSYGDHAWRDGQAIRGLQVHDELKDCRLFDGEIRRQASLAAKRAMR